MSGRACVHASHRRLCRLRARRALRRRNRLGRAADRSRRLRTSTSARTARARRCSLPEQRRREARARRGARSTRASRARTRRRSSSRSTTPAVGRRVTRRASPARCGRYDGPLLPNVVARARRPTGRTGQRRAGSGRCPISASRRGRRSSPSSGSRSRTGPARSRSSRRARTGCTAAASRASSAGYTYLGQPVYGFHTTRVRRADRPLRPADLSRHVRLGVRLGLEARELVRAAQPDRRLLLRLLQLRSRRRAATSTRPAGPAGAGPEPARSTASPRAAPA